jgi:UDP-glucose 4-epimerase
VAALRGESLQIHGDGLQSRDFTYVQNVVLANCLAAESDQAAGEVFNVACGRQHSLMDIVELLDQMLWREDRSIRRHHTPARPGDVRHTLADIGRPSGSWATRSWRGSRKGCSDPWRLCALRQHS